MVCQDRFLGCVLGLALGDALGAPFEGGLLERVVWRVLGTTRTGEMRWTDDTQMSVDLMESLLATGDLDPDDLATRFAQSYRWSRGYGPATARLLKRVYRGIDWRIANRSVYREGSFGNGAAMRSPIIGLAYANRPSELDRAARLSAEVTHAHTLAIEGTMSIARATAAAIHGLSQIQIVQQAAFACTQEQFTSRLAIARKWLDSADERPISEVTRILGNGVEAHESCVTSLYLSLRFRDRPLLELLRFIATGGGDVDTIGAMAGAIWGATNGAAQLPPTALSKLEQREKLERLARTFHQRFGTDQPE